jgi:aminomethyltransferase
VSARPSMRASYTVFCNDDGSLKDDAILYKVADDDYLLMPSDIDHSPYFESMRQRFKLGDVAFTECTDTWFGVAVQGPKSAAVLQNMGFDDIDRLKPFEVCDYGIGSGMIRLARVGFTADLGYECWFEPGLAEEFMRRVEATRSTMNIALPGYGLSALQACRLEGGFVVAGWDFSTELDPQPGFERSPFDIGLGWLVNLDAEEFVGRDALLEQKANGHQFELRGFELDKRSPPKDGTELYAAADDNTALVGSVNCSSWSWGMDRTIGNASITSEYNEIEEAWLPIGGKRVEVKLRRGPFINLERRNQVPAPTDL